MDPHDLQEVRKLIEKSTSKVSLRDLEKKGFRKVKVLRSNDIDEMIRRAVGAVLAREGMTEAQSEAIVEKSKEELKNVMAAAQAAEQERAEIAAEKEELEAQARELRTRLAQRTDLESKLKELQRRLADEEEARQRVEEKLRASEQFEEIAVNAGRRIADLERQLKSKRTDDGEVDDLRMRLKRVETEKRLQDELEMPKLRERIADLEGDLRLARSSAAPPPQDMRAMFKELLQEVGAGKGGSDPGLVAEFQKMQKSIAESLARAGGRGSGEVTEADLDAAKVSIAALFQHDDAARNVQSNIGTVELKEQTTAQSNVKSNLNKLKSLRKGGGS
jgi:hypothetical protein